MRENLDVSQFHLKHDRFFSQSTIIIKLYSMSDTHPYVRLFIDRIILIKIKHLRCSIHRSCVFGKLQHAKNYSIKCVTLWKKWKIWTARMLTGAKYRIHRQINDIITQMIWRKTLLQVFTKQFLIPDNDNI